MNKFYKALTYVNEIFYEPHHLTIKAIQEETQNSDYGAEITPIKIGQFVAFWEKDLDNKNQAFSYENATDLLVINTLCLVFFYYFYIGIKIIPLIDSLSYHFKSTFLKDFKYGWYFIFYRTSN
jgi:hypothetical protein